MCSWPLKPCHHRDDSARVAWGKSKAAPKPEAIESRFSSGECILELGSEMRQLYVVQSGHVRLEAAGHGESRLLGPGSLFGEVTAITGTPSPYRVEADDETTLLVIDVPLLNRLCRESSEFAFRLIHQLADDLGGALASGPMPMQARSLALGGALEALGSVILERSAGVTAPCEIDGKLGELAGDAGLSLQSAYLALHSMLDKRWLRLVDDRLSLLQRDELKALGRT